MDHSIIHLSCSFACVQVQTFDYSCIVFDTAPTGHTLRLLNFPSVLEKGLGKLMSLKQSMGGMMSQVRSLLHFIVVLASPSDRSSAGVCQ